MELLPRLHTDIVSRLDPKRMEDLVVLIQALVVHKASVDGWVSKAA